MTWYKANFRTSFRPLAYVLTVTVICFSLRCIYNFIDGNFPQPTEKVSLPGFNEARVFITNGYPEIKTLGIQFLTLVTAILVFSITFSEKIINYNISGNLVKMILILAWCLLVSSIIFDGIGLSYNAYALPVALTEEHITTGDVPGFYLPAFKAVKIILFAGVCFILGIGFILIGAVISMFKK